MSHSSAARLHTGWIKEMHIDASGHLSAWIACPPSAVPPPGSYVLASSEEAVLGIPLFPQARFEGGFLSASAAPCGWEPGAQLLLRGPLGNGFSLPLHARRLALAAFGETISRLLPLAEIALRQDTAVALFSDASFPALPPAVEAGPLAALPEALAWADYLALDVPLEVMPALGESLGLTGQSHIPCPGQALVLAPMPCAGLAECGVCALRTRLGWKLACKEGPVFNLADLNEYL